MIVSGFTSQAFKLEVEVIARAIHDQRNWPAAVGALMLGPT